MSLPDLARSRIFHSSNQGLAIACLPIQIKYESRARTKKEIKMVKSISSTRDKDIIIEN